LPDKNTLHLFHVHRSYSACHAVADSNDVHCHVVKPVQCRPPWHTEMTGDCRALHR